MYQRHLNRSTDAAGKMKAILDLRRGETKKSVKGPGQVLEQAMLAMNRTMIDSTTFARDGQPSFTMQGGLSSWWEHELRRDIKNAQIQHMAYRTVTDRHDGQTKTRKDTRDLQGKNIDFDGTMLLSRGRGSTSEARKIIRQAKSNHGKWTN